MASGLANHRNKNIAVKTSGGSHTADSSSLWHLVLVGNRRKQNFILGAKKPCTNLKGANRLLTCFEDVTSDSD